MLYILSAIAGAALFATGFFVGRAAMPAQAAPKARDAPDLAIKDTDSAEESMIKANKQWANMMAYKGEDQHEH